MLLQQFPDIDMVRRLRNDATQPVNTWKNVALNIKCRQVSRTGVESPYSLFLNRKGHSYCTVSRQQYTIATDTFLLTQPGDIYGLTIDNYDQTEICNLHINRDFFNDIAYTISCGDEQLLHEPATDRTAMPLLFTQLYRKDVVLNRLIDRLCAVDRNDAATFEVILWHIAEHLLLNTGEIQRKIAGLPYVKQSVRIDIYKRLAIAKDYIHSNHTKDIDLDDICRHTGMSKFHFLRLFARLYGMTPYQYLTNIRMEQAKRLLTTTDEPISAISDTLGFEYPNSFIKAFQKSYGMAPTQYRGRR